jgi:hypothetical protein
VSTGETVRLSCRDVVESGEVSASKDVRIGASAASSPSPIVDSSAASTSSRKSPLGSVDELPSWRDLDRKGDYPGAFEAANRLGIDSLLATGSVSDLAELSDVARLAKKTDVARRVALGLRDRFPGTDAAANAAFQLGRMSSGTSSEGEKWFQVYLSERPSGRFETETLGRLLEIQNATGETDAAHATATTYLARHPDGAHAQLAHSILQP